MRKKEFDIKIEISLENTKITFEGFEYSPINHEETIEVVDELLSTVYSLL